MRWFKSAELAALLVVTLFLNACNQDESDDPDVLELKQGLGEDLFNDVSLSRDGTQSCASCHDVAYAFADPMVNRSSVDGEIAGAVSLGQDDLSLGDINTPSVAYAAFVPDFHFDEEEGLFKGGMFLDGRSANLQQQAMQPFLNELEMQSSVEDVVAKVQDSYGQAMRLIYGENIFDSDDEAFEAVADSIAEFEKTQQFATFDSKFDRVLAGEAQLTDLEQRGLDLFEAEDKGNCAACHPVPEFQAAPAESLLTDFSYDNLGLPKNELARSVNGKDVGFVDLGLFGNPEVDDAELKGAFRVSSLRNIALTAPYMHNGVFRNLETVVRFYNSRDVPGALNPETGLPWREAEIDATKNTDELGDLGLQDDEIDAIVAFLKTLTDERYEPLVVE